MKYVLVAALFVMSYFLVKTCVWANIVAAQYMAAHFETTRCNKFLSAHYDNAVVKENGMHHQVAPICPYDEKACKKAEDMWKEYEQNIAKYHRWFPL